MGWFIKNTKYSGLLLALVFCSVCFMGFVQFSGQLGGKQEQIEFTNRKLLNYIDRSPSLSESVRTFYQDLPRVDWSFKRVSTRDPTNNDYLQAITLLATPLIVILLASISFVVIWFLCTFFHCICCCAPCNKKTYAYQHVSKNTIIRQGLSPWIIIVFCAFIVAGCVLAMVMSQYQGYLLWYATSWSYDVQKQFTSNISLVVDESKQLGIYDHISNHQKFIDYVFDHMKSIERITPNLQRTWKIQKYSLFVFYSLLLFGCSLCLFAILNYKWVRVPLFSALLIFLLLVCIVWTLAIAHFSAGVIIADQCPPNSLDEFVITKMEADLQTTIRYYLTCRGNSPFLEVTGYAQQELQKEYHSPHPNNTRIEQWRTLLSALDNVDCTPIYTLWHNPDPDNMNPSADSIEQYICLELQNQFFFYLIAEIIIGLALLVTLIFLSFLMHTTRTNSVFGEESRLYSL